MAAQPCNAQDVGFGGQPTAVVLRMQVEFRRSNFNWDGLADG